MNKASKFFICLFFIFCSSMFFHFSFAKYTFENIYTVAKINIHNYKPDIQLVNITTSNSGYTNYANKSHTITCNIKVTGSNLVKNSFSKDTIKILINNNKVSPTFKSFKIISENSHEKVYQFSFTNTLGDGTLTIEIPEGIIENKNGIKNEKKLISTNITIDNTQPSGTFKEIPSLDNKSLAQITCTEPVREMPGWTFSNNILSREFANYITYELPITDLAQNSAKVLISIKNATNILLEYGTYDIFSKKSFVTGGKISSYSTVYYGFDAKIEALYMRLSGNIESDSLQGRCYINTYWGNGSYNVCKESGLTYYHGYNNWIDSTSGMSFIYSGKTYTQLGGIGMNVENAVAVNVNKPIPSAVAKNCPYGISDIQFRLKDNADYSVVYQALTRYSGWIKASSDGEEHLYNQSNPFSGFRMNIVPKSDKQYLLDYWNKDKGSYNTN